MRTSLIALLALGLSVGVAESKGFYVSTSFGPNFDGESSLPFVNEETGLVGMVAVGTSIDSVPGLRVEGEAAFRTHESNIGPFTLEHDTTTFMVNAVYDAHGLAMGRVVPYGLIGAGVAQTELTFGGIAPLTVENSGFAWQAGLGLNYQVSQNVALGLGYRYLEAPEAELFGFELDGGSNHSVLATATFTFN